MFSPLMLLVALGYWALKVLVPITALVALYTLWQALNHHPIPTWQAVIAGMGVISIIYLLGRVVFRD